MSRDTFSHFSYFCIHMCVREFMNLEVNGFHKRRHDFITVYCIIVQSINIFRDLAFFLHSLVHGSDSSKITNMLYVCVCVCISVIFYCLLCCSLWTYFRSQGALCHCASNPILFFFFLNALLLLQFMLFYLQFKTAFSLIEVLAVWFLMYSCIISYIQKLKSPDVSDTCLCRIACVFLYWAMAFVAIKHLEYT